MSEPSDSFNTVNRRYQFFWSSEYAAKNNDPDFFRDILDKVVSVGLVSPENVGEFIRLGLKSACSETISEVDNPDIRGWKNLSLVLSEFKLLADLDKEVGVMVKSEDEEFFRSLFARPGEVIDDFDRFEFMDEDDPEYDSDQYMPAYKHALTSEVGRQILQIMDELVDNDKPITLDHIKQARALIKSEPDLRLRDSLDIFLDQYIFPCAQDYMTKGRQTGKYEYIELAYKVIKYASFDKRQRMHTALDKYLYSFLVIISDEDDYENNKRHLIDTYVSSSQRGLQLYQALKPHV